MHVGNLQNSYKFVHTSKEKYFSAYEKSKFIQKELGVASMWAANPG